MKKRFLFISCDEAKHICDKSQYGEANSWELIKLNLRLSWCRITKAYSNRNRKLTQVMKSSNNNDCMNTSERDSIQEKFNKELAKQQ